MTPELLDDRTLAERGGPSRPSRVRIVHLGLGSFHRAHQAWYTAQAADAADWGIAAFTGRTPWQAEVLARQDGLYCLVVRSEAGDTVQVVPSILEVHDAGRIDRLAELLADPEVAIVTLTVTEAGYRLTPTGEVDAEDAVTTADISQLRSLFAAGRLTDAAPRTALTRLLVGLEARRRSGGTPIAVVPCDNIPANGAFVARGLVGLAREVSADLAEWIRDAVSFVGTSVDRITPHVEGEIDAVRDAGWIDRSPVVTEPFSDWVLSGDFPAGRPAWETAGARFVDDLEPWESRKLWLLNGAHSLLAFTGLPRGHETVAAAIADPVCRAAVEELWAEAVRLLPADIEHVEYRRALLQRFGNSRIAHSLTQIAGDSTTKVRYRLGAVAERTRARGEVPTGSARAIAAWIEAVRAGVLPPDGETDAIARGAASVDDVAALIGVVSSALAADPIVVDAVREALRPSGAAPAPSSHPAH